jgi:hypothetical protein
MRIKTTMRYHLLSVRMAFNNKIKYNKNWSVWIKRNICILLPGVSISILIMENSAKVPQKIKNRATTLSRNTTNGYIVKGNEISMLKRCVHSHVRWSNIHNKHKCNQLMCPAMNVWMNKKVIHIYKTEYNSAFKKKEILSFVTT